jgi:hypothetical protein
VKLLTQELRAAIPPLYATDGQPDTEKMVVAKFFAPDSNWTWYVLEGSPVDEDGFFDTDKPKVDFFFFGLVDGFERELGYFALSELETSRGPLGLAIERDRYFEPVSLAALRQQLVY